MIPIVHYDTKIQITVILRFLRAFRPVSFRNPGFPDPGNVPVFRTYGFFTCIDIKAD